MLTRRPLALIDVDGVLNPYAAADCPPGYTEHALFDDDEMVRVNPGHGALLRRLTPRFDLIWATSWEQNANRLLAPLLGLPELPVIEFPPADGPYDKFPEIAATVGDRACVWFDDLHSAAAQGWAAARLNIRLIPIDPAVGLLELHIAEAITADLR